MGYKNLQSCLKDLEKTKQLVRIETEVDPYLEVGAIQRRVYQAKGPALLFTRVKGCPFPLLGNLYGTLERIRFLFRDTLRSVEALMALKEDPLQVIKKPSRYLKAPLQAWHTRPKKVSQGPVMNRQIRVDQLPALISWPLDGGPFITLPQVYTESTLKPGFAKSNLGMYRVQLSGNRYSPNKEVGLHYQIHRGIGVHHAEALAAKQPLKVNIFVGGAPAMTLASIMPLPEGLPEISFAGVLGGHRIPMICKPQSLPFYAEADFCITGTIIPGKLLPEGPFGDHLGYYSLVHDYPVLQVDHVFCRKNAIWPFTTVGRPPQEDTHFGEFIHELTAPVIPSVIPGIKAVHAVDATGVHPLLLAIGSERYTPYKELSAPQEILTQANALLGQGQLSLAKYVMITNHESDPELDIHDVQDFLRHVLERIDLRRDLHFQTQTTMDSLDYSGGQINQGSKLVIAACGPKIRDLPVHLPQNIHLPDDFGTLKLCLPGILALKTAPYQSPLHTQEQINRLCQALKNQPELSGFVWLVLVDDAEFTARTLNNFLWITFTRSDPASDLYGLNETFHKKHWGCDKPLILDARLKPHHAPPLIDDPAIEKQVDHLAKFGGPLYGIV